MLDELMIIFLMNFNELFEDDDELVIIFFNLFENVEF